MRRFITRLRDWGGTPSWYRSLCVGLALWLAAGSSRAVLAEELSEAQVIALSLERDSSALVARQGVVLAEAARAGAGLYLNPSLSYTRESFPGGSSRGESEDALLLSVPLDLSPRRAAQEHLARAGVSQARAQAALVQSDGVVQSVSLLYSILAEQRRLGIEQRLVERLAEAARIVTRRRQEGAASGYDQARVELEAELAASELRQTRERVARLGLELSLRLGVDAGATTFTGTLDLDAGIAAEGGSGETPSERPSLRLSREVEARATDADAEASGVWLPTVAVSAGPRVGSADETRYGYVAGLSLSLPLFSRGQGLRARAAAQREQARAVVSAAERATAIEGARAGQLLAAVRKELAQFDEATRERLERLERGAVSGYREGERSIVELIDAGRVRTATELRALELSLTAKRAELSLRAARGEFE